MKTFILAASVAAVAAAGTGLAVCPQGTWRKHDFAPGMGQNCFECAPGTFSEGLNAAQCTPCMAGRFSKAWGAKTRSTCTSCTAGSYWPINGLKAQRIGATDDCRDSNGAECACGSTGCIDKRVCETCPAGEYQDTVAARSCIQCEPGTYREATGGKSKGACTKCNMDDFDFVKTSGGEYIYGATKLNEACKLRPVNCVMGEWSKYERCSAVCNGGTQTATRSVKIEGAFGGLKCDNMETERTQSCNTRPCSELNKRWPSYEEMQDGSWWEMTFDQNAHDAVIGRGMSAECRWQKDVSTGPFAWIAGAENVIVHQGTSTVLPNNQHVEGWCCQATTNNRERIGNPFCYQTEVDLQTNFDVFFWGQKYEYDETTGKMCKQGACAQFKPVFVHKKLCNKMTCVVEEHECSKYRCMELDGENTNSESCPNRGHRNCIGKHKSLRVTHSHEEDVGGHFCSVTGVDADGKQKCECYCHDIYRNMQRSPTFGQAVQMQAKAVFEASRKKCTLPPSGKGSQYDAFTEASAAFEFNGESYEPAGPCQGAGCWVVRGSTYSSNCMMPAQGATPVLEQACTGFGTQACTGSTHSSQCGVQLTKNSAKPASFFRLMNNKGAGFTPGGDDGIYFKDATGKTLLYINPGGPEFASQNDYSYFGDVPEETDYVFLKGGGQGQGSDYSGVTVAFYTC